MLPASTTACGMTRRSLMCCPCSPTQPQSPMPAEMASCCGETSGAHPTIVHTSLTMQALRS